MTIQQKCAERIYELLPHKKELEFGCYIKLKNDEGSDFPLGRFISEIVLVNAPDEKGVQAEIFGSTCVQHFPLVDFQKYYETIGQPIRLADVLMAVNNTNRKSNGYIPYVIGVNGLLAEQDKIGLDEGFYYNLSKDNILEQSDEVCEYIYKILGGE